MSLLRTESLSRCVTLRALFCLVLLVSGCGSGSPPPSPHLVLSASAIAFPDQRAGTVSPAQVMTISNSGNASLQIGSVVLTGTGTAAFTLSNACGSSLAPGATCTLSASFNPPGAGPFAATLAITGSDGASANAPVTGTGIAPLSQFTQTQITFPGMDVGYASDPSPLGITNTGTAPLDLSGMTLSGSGAPAFTVNNPCPRSLAIGATCSLSLVFTPATATAYAALLTIPASAGNPAASVALSGTGTPDNPLSSWNFAYEHCKTQPVNILVLGDSRSIVDLTILPGLAGMLSDTFGQKWADRLAAALGATCGSHGSGLVPLLPLAASPYVNGDYYQVDGTWTTSFGLGPQQFGSVPANQVLQTTSAATINFNVAAPFDHLNTYCESGPGLNPWTISIDGSPAGTCGGPGTSPQAVLSTSIVVPLATHTAVLACAQAPCAVYGMEATAGKAGVSVHNLSIGSCAAECFGQDPASQLAFSDLIPGHHLVILELVTNEPGVGYSPSSFASSLGNIIDHERAHPGSPSILIYAPLQDSIAGQAPFYPVLPSIAGSYSTAYLDLRAIYGTAFLPQYFGPDGDHENNQGHALTYEQIYPLLTSPTQAVTSVQQP